MIRSQSVRLDVSPILSDDEIKALAKTRSNISIVRDRYGIQADSIIIIYKNIILIVILKEM